MDAPSANTPTQTPRSPRKIKWFAWLIFLLPFFAFLSPIIGAQLQGSLVGPEHVCCMPDNYEELLRAANANKQLRWLSDDLMIGSMATGIIALFIFALLFLFYISPRLSKPSQIILSLIVIIITTTLMFYLFINLNYYTTYTDDYYSTHGMFFPKFLP